MKIQPGNQKLGTVANLSLLPVASCPWNIPCAKDCYYVKFCKMWPNVKRYAERNWRDCQSNRSKYFSEIREYLETHTLDMFRWHVGGDIPDQEYLREMYRIAREFPEVRFLAFTKAHQLDYRRLPDNLNIVFSMWPGWGNTRKRMPRAWMQDGTETRIPDDAMECTGGCETCGICWHLKAGQSVWFHKH